MKDRFYNEVSSLKDVLIRKKVNVEKDSNLRVKSIFKYKIKIQSIIAVKQVFLLIKKYHLKYYILGKGSNVLFARRYFNGVLVVLDLDKNPNLSIINSSDSINYLNSKYLNLGIASLNFLSGVPCSVGGAIYMNAGAFGKSLSDYIEYVYAVDLKTFKIKVFSNGECEFGYRNSHFQNNKYLILGAKIKLIYCDKSTLLDRHHKYLSIRQSKLPLEYPNLGSIFKNPQGDFAGRLIESLHLKGLKFGGAMVSYKHANVIINYNKAKYRDVLKLMHRIKKKVYKSYKIELKEEIIIFK